MDLSYKFPSGDNVPKKERVQYMPVEENLVSRFQRNQTNLRLLRLPAELCIKIWQHTLGGNRILPPGFVPCSDDFHPCLTKIYLFAEPYENMRYFLSLLYVCRQIYHEARLIPFTCNVWEFWMENNFYKHNRRVGWMEGISLEQYHAIEWILIGGRRWTFGRDEEQPRDDGFWVGRSSMKGIKVIIRRLPMHEIDVEKLDILAKQRGCRVIDEETVELTGVYTRTGRLAR